MGRIRAIWDRNLCNRIRHAGGLTRHSQVRPPIRVLQERLASLGVPPLQVSWVHRLLLIAEQHPPLNGEKSGASMWWACLLSWDIRDGSVVAYKKTLSDRAALISQFLSASSMRQPFQIISFKLLHNHNYEHKIMKQCYIKPMQIMLTRLFLMAITQTNKHSLIMQCNATYATPTYANMPRQHATCQKAKLIFGIITPRTIQE